MRRSVDTSPDARRRQLAAYRAMAPEKRLRLAAAMSAEVRSLSEAGRRARGAGDGRAESDAGLPAPDSR